MQNLTSRLDFSRLLSSFTISSSLFLFWAPTSLNRAMAATELADFWFGNYIILVWACASCYMCRLRAFLAEYLAAACAMKSAVCWHWWADAILKAPWGNRAHRVIRLNGVHLCGLFQPRTFRECACAFFFPSMFRVRVPGQQAAPLFSSVSASLGCRCLENWDLSTAFWEWTGNPNHSLSQSVASFRCGMMVLLHAVHISNYPESSPTYLENFIILCNPHTVFFLWESFSLYLCFVH